jgi:hypothetical protein
MINRCRIYLQVISLYDLLLFLRSEIHQSYILSEPQPSPISAILWPTFPQPAKHYWKVWSHFIHFRIQPMINKWNSYGIPFIHRDVAHPFSSITSLPIYIDGKRGI